MRQDDWFNNDEDDINDILHHRTEELYNIPDTAPDEEGIIECPVLPLRDLIVFPRMVSPLFIGREISLMAIEEAQENNQTVIALTQIDPDIEEPGLEDFIPIGVEMAVGHLLQMPDGSSSSLVQGRRRVEIIEFIQDEPFLYVRARPIVEPVEFNREIEALMRMVLGLFERVVDLNRSIPEEAHLFALNIDDPSWLSDLIITAISPPLDERQRVLVEVDPIKRLNLVSNILAKELDVLELEDEIHSRVQKEVDRTQREAYLREQMKAIQSELGEGDLWNKELAELRARIEGAPLPEEVQTRALKELGRLSQIPPMSPEVGIIRTYLDWILELPWVNTTKDNLEVKHAAKVLEKYHYGLPKIKDRILEYIAVRSLQPGKRSKQPILCFVGPPGTGKTSLGRSIAEALGREFVRISLGGVRDEAEIRGHRRTYIGAMPGRILQTIRRAGTNNPLFMLDEIDKLSSDYRGDPSSAMLEVLDPEQNHAFSDHYLEISYDLSNVLFITTANWAGRIPDPLLDRMEVIEFDGYIEEEKIEIARRFLIKRQLEENGLDKDEVQISDQALQRIIREYTYEAGVRNLEREIARIARKIARKKAEGREYTSIVKASSIEKFLGPPQFFNTEAERQDEIGVATALAWTVNGGDIMPIEVLLLEGKGNMQITGQIGDVMQESVHAGFSYMKSRARPLNIKPETYDDLDIHIHIPEGSIPKDGPSAGITLATALISVFTKRRVRKDVGMTGEITLRGRILPVGGIREKVLAAHRSGLKTVIIPARNKKDIVDLPRKARQDLKIVFASHMDQVLEIALFPPNQKQSRGKQTPKPREISKGAAATAPPGA